MKPSEQFATVFEHAPTGAALLALQDGRLLGVNPALCDMLGYRRAELERKRVTDIASNGIQLADDETSQSVAEWRCRHADGREIVAELRAWRLDDDSAILQIRDIQAERALRESEKRLQDIVDNATAPIYIKDTKGRYILINRHYEQLYGLRREEVKGKTDRDLFPEETAARVLENDRRVLAARKVFEFEETAPAGDGFHTFISLKFPMLDERGEPYAMGGISTDITERKRAEAAAKEAREEAERANRAKSEFLSRMSHELRTPLNSILGFGQLLQIEELAPTAGQHVDRIVRAGRHLLSLINEVLDISRIEAGVQLMSVEPVHACDPLHEALELVRPLAEDRDIEVAVDLHGGLYRFVCADAQRLTQVLLNLLANAVKYNRDGGRVTVAFRSAEGRLRFLIADMGPGLDEDDAERIFMPFQRVAADTEGTGLGLALSKALIEAMGGGIGIERTAKDEGTTFFVELPLTERPRDAPDVVLKQDARGVDAGGLQSGTILYIEDNLDSLDVVRHLLGGRVELIPAMQGKHGLELAARHHPDLIVLDLHLPDVPGDEVLRRLKRDKGTGEIPVVVLSADATPLQIERLKRAGADEYLTKPLDVPHFLDTVRRTLQR